MRNKDTTLRENVLYLILFEIDFIYLRHPETPWGAQNPDITILERSFKNISESNISQSISSDMSHHTQIKPLLMNTEVVP